MTNVNRFWRLIGLPLLAATMPSFGMTVSAMADVVIPSISEDIVWDSAGPSTAYTNNQNWDPNVVPDNPDPQFEVDGMTAVIRSGATSGNQATISAGDLVRPDYLHVWTELGDAGVLNISGGELRVGVEMRVETEVTPDGCCWVPDDRDTAAVVNQTGGAVTVGTDFHLGRDNIVPAKGIYNLSGGSLDIGGAYISGDAAAGESADTGSAVMNLSGNASLVVHSDWSGTDAIGDPVQNQQDGTLMAGQLNIFGNSTAVWENPNVNLAVGGSNAGDGRIHIKDNGSLTVNGSMTLANQQFTGNLNQAEFRMEGGTAALADVELGSWVADSLDTELGRAEAFFNLSGGSATAANIVVGGFYSTHAELNVSGGSLQVSGATTVGRDFNGVAQAEGFVNVTGGSFQTDTLVVGIMGLGSVAHSNGTVKVLNGVTIAEQPEALGSYNLTGGVLDMSGSDLVFGQGDAVFTFDGGTLRGAANVGFDLVNNGGTLAPGSPGAGTTNVAGDYLAVSPNAVLEIELGGAAAGQFDRLAVTGQALLDGSLNVSLINGFTPANGDSFDILDFGTIAGNFSTVNLPALGAGLTWDQSGLLTNGILAIIGGGLIGDFNGNGVLDAPDIDDLTGQSAGGLNNATYDLNADTLVDSGDVDMWINDLFNSWIGDANLDGEFNTTDLVDVLAAGTYEVDVPSVWTTGDFNGSGRTDSSDLVAALAGGGYEAGPKAAVGVANVPEPTALSLWIVMCSIIGLTARKLRRMA
jgi:hypothetical protein